MSEKSTKPEAIKTLRKQAQLTQAELGERLGVTTRMVKMWEAGKHMMEPFRMTMARLLFDDVFLTEWLREQIKRRPKLKEWWRYHGPDNR